MDNYEYNDLVERLAEEIIDGEMEVEAGCDDYGMEVEAGIKDKLRGVRTGLDRFTGDLTGANYKNLKNNLPENAEALAAALKRRRISRAGVGAAAAGALGAGGYAGYRAYRNHQAQKEAEEYLCDVFEKAAATYEEAQYMKEASEQAYVEASACEDASIEVLAELGYFD